MLLAGGTAARGEGSPGGHSPAVSTPFVDFHGQQPGLSHRITARDLPPPNATRSVDNGARLVRRPKDAWPQAPAGFTVQLYADGLTNPRLIRTAPNGDALVTESEAGRVRLFRGVTAQGRAAQTALFASGLSQPFGIAFYPAGPAPQWVYVANTDSVVRFPYRSGDLRRAAAPRR